MLQLDTNTATPTLTNISVPSYMSPRMNGAMIHVPVGNYGVIVQIAGQTETAPPSPTPAYGVGIQNADASTYNINNTQVDIYDIETGIWFKQATFASSTTGWPAPRADICTILVAAPDGTSWNIFMIAGVCK